MNKNKKVIFALLMCVCISFITYPYVSNLFTHKGQDSLRKVTLKSGDYKVGEDFPEGQYDVQSTTNDAVFMQKKMSNNDKWMGISFNDGESIPLKGTFILTPSKRKPLKTNDTGKYEISNSGYYEIGNQIPAGKYTLTYESQNSMIEKPLIQVLSKKRSILKGYSFEQAKQYTIELKKEEILEIQKSLFIENNADVILSPM